MTKTLMITTGTNDAQTETKASTEAGYIKAATALCGMSISHGTQKLRIKVVEDGEVVFEAHRTVNA